MGRIQKYVVRFINSAVLFTQSTTSDILLLRSECVGGRGHLKPDWDLQYCSSGINKLKKHSESSVYVCVYCYAYVSIQPSGSAAKAANGYYLLYMKYCIVHVGLNSRIHWLQLISWYQWAWAFTTGILQESVLVFDPFHWNGIIIISIIIIIIIIIILRIYKWWIQKWYKIPYAKTNQNENKIPQSDMLQSSYVWQESSFCRIIKTSQWK